MKSIFKNLIAVLFLSCIALMAEADSGGQRIGNLDISKDFKDIRYDLCPKKEEALKIKFLPHQSLDWRTYAMGELVGSQQQECSFVVNVVNGEPELLVKPVGWDTGGYCVVHIQLSDSRKAQVSVGSSADWGTGACRQ